MVVSADEVRSLRKAWSTFVEGSPAPVGTRPEIVASWRRSQLSQVSVDGLNLPFTPVAMADSKLLLAAEPVLNEFADSIAGSPVSVILADRTGRVVARWSGDSALERQLEAESVSLGFLLTEEHAGTNGIGTALEMMRPVEVYGPEHYAKSLHALTCAGAPLRNPLSRQIEGVVNLACPNAEVNGLLLPTVIDLAQRIGREMHARSTHREQAVLDAFLLANRTVRGPIVAVSDSFMMANSAATSLLDGITQSSLWEQIPERLGEAAVSGTIHLDHESVSATFRGVVVGGRTVGSIIELGSDRPSRRPHDDPSDTSVSDLRAAGLVGCSQAWKHVCRTALRVQRDRPLVILGEPGIGKRAIAEYLHQHHDIGEMRLLPASLELVNDQQHWLRLLHEALSNPKVGTVVILQAQELSPRCARAASELIGATRRACLVVATVTTSAADPAPASLMNGLNNVQTLALLPLRERLSDLQHLAEHHMATAGSQLPSKRLSADATTALARHSWPGNIRELNAVIEAALGQRRGPVVTSVDLPASVTSSGRAPGLTRIEAVERAAMQQALAETNGNKSAAAAALGMSRKTFHRRVHRYRIDDNGAF